MRYVALLRGVNVGGANKVSMAELKNIFEAAGMASVRTYINSGNIIFFTEMKDRIAVVDLLEEVLKGQTGLGIDVQLRDSDELGAIVDAIPPEWKNDDSMKRSGRVLLDSPDEFLGDSAAHQAACSCLRSVDQ